MNKSTVPAGIQCWEDIDFSKAEKKVEKLQRRIATARANDNLDVVEILQQKLIHSFCAKALAVKAVSSTDGKKTPGIDGVLWNSPQQKFDAIGLLRRRGYKVTPLRRVHIPKPDGGSRPLGIPTMNDRAMQMLYKTALDPVAVVTADRCSFAYLPGRDARGAIVCLDRTLRDNPQFRWVMKADIEGCFNNIDHQWLLEHIPMDRKILSAFLKSGYVEDSKFYPTEKGIPQGGCISSVLCNMTLDGMEKVLDEHFGLSVRMVRYADDMIIIGECRETLVQAVTPVISRFLSERGLALSNKKTGYYPANKGVSFLGWKTYRDGDRVISEPTCCSVRRLLDDVGTIGKQSISYQERCRKISSKVRGWLNYYVGISPRQSLNDVEFIVTQSLYALPDGRRLAGDISNLFKSILETI